MNAWTLQAAGAIAGLTAIFHAVLGETRIFAKARIEPGWIRLMLRLIWQCGALAWLALAALLVAAPGFDGNARGWIVAAAAANFLVAAIANAWATRGRHVGWMLMATASALALASL